MGDVHEPEVRSYNMSRIKGKDTKPELIVRKYLYNHGYRYRLYVKTLPGKPDIVIKKLNTVIFMHSCFWHAHRGCKLFVTSEKEGWKEKIEKNVLRDLEVEYKLKKEKWNVLVIWECELEPRRKQSEKREETLNKLKEKLDQTKSLKIRQQS